MVHNLFEVLSMDSSTSGGQAISSTVTAGIQDISALLPLLGTEQCEDHASSALTKGFLYAAASPISLFGSLGVARAGFKTLMSAISITPPKSIPWLKFEGAKLLADAGFKPQGINLSLIMLDEDQKSFCAEKHLDSMMKELHIEDSNRVAVSARTWSWNIKMILVAGLSSIISIAPYIHLNLGPNKLNHFVRWMFPIIRAIGGFLTTTMIQLVIQSRLLVIVRKQLILKGLRGNEVRAIAKDESAWNHYSSLDQRFLLLERHVKKKLNPPSRPVPNQRYSPLPILGQYIRRSRAAFSSADIEMQEPGGPSAAVAPTKIKADEEGECFSRERLETLRGRIPKAKGDFVLIWSFFLLAGVVASVVGYIGCFSAVQGSSSSKEALIWLVLEAGLSVVRIILWGINPDCDDAPPLEFSLSLDVNAPFPTCTKTAEEIESDKVLPLVRASEFLQSITSYAGLLQRFNDPTLSLYYTLTRTRVPGHHDPPLSTPRALYITIFDHTERTARVYTETPRDASHAKEQDYPCFYSADPITVDLEHGILRTKLGPQIRHKHDPIVINNDMKTELQEHYRSILEKVNLRYGNTPEPEIFEDDWRLKFEETARRAQDEKGQRNKENRREDVYQKRDVGYFMQGRLEQKAREVIHLRGERIKEYMNWLSADMAGDPQEAPELGRIEVRTSVKKEEVETLLLSMEREEIEMFLVDEMRGWEKELREGLEDMIKKSGIEGEELRRTWRADLWERVEKGRKEMEERIAGVAVVEQMDVNNFTTALLKRLGPVWQSLFKELDTRPSLPHQSPTCRLEKALEVMEKEVRRVARLHKSKWFNRRLEGMKRRLRSEAREVEARLTDGLEHCSEPKWDYSQCINFSYSEKKWRRISQLDVGIILMLPRNQHVTHIYLDLFSDDLNSVFHAIPTLTSISCKEDSQIPADINLPPNLLSISGCTTPLSNEHERVLGENLARLERSRKTAFEFSGMELHHDGSLLYARARGKVTIRFFGPPSGLLILRLTHSAEGTDQSLEVGINELPVRKYQVRQLNSVEEIVIHSKDMESSCSGPIFKPDCRNVLTCIPMAGYRLFDIELMDERRDPYRPREVGNDGNRPQVLEVNRG